MGKEALSSFPPAIRQAVQRNGWNAVKGVCFAGIIYSIHEINDPIIRVIVCGGTLLVAWLTEPPVKG